MKLSVRSCICTLCIVKFDHEIDFNTLCKILLANKTSNFCDTVLIIQYVALASELPLLKDKYRIGCPNNFVEVTLVLNGYIMLFETDILLKS